MAEVEARSHGDLIQNLMASDLESEGLEERAGLLGHDLSEEQAVVAFVPVGETATAEPVGDLLRRPSRRRPGRPAGPLRQRRGKRRRAARAADRALCRESVSNWIAAFREELTGRAEEVDFHCGISNLPCAGAEVREGLAEARQAASMCRLTPGQEVSCFEDVQLIATLIDITNDEAIERYIERTIGLLGVRLAQEDGTWR